MLRFYEQLSVAETAALMGCAPGTVTSLTHRAIEQLREHAGLLDDDQTDDVPRRSRRTP